MAEIRELGLPVLEDAAQAAGASLNGRRAGSLSDLATFSFYPSKNLGAFGDGGAITTDDDEIADLVRALRFHGSCDKQNFEYVGYNSRLDEIQAAVLRVLLARAGRLVRRPRGRRREAYAEAGIERVRRRARRARRRRAGVAPVRGHARPRRRADRRPRGAWHPGSRRTTATPLHRQKAMAPYAPPRPDALPVTDELARTNLALPMSPTLDAERAGEVVAALAGCVEADSGPALDQVLVGDLPNDPRRHAHHHVARRPRPW